MDRIPVTDRYQNFKLSHGEKEVKKLFSIFLAGAFALSMVGVVFSTAFAALTESPTVEEQAAQAAAPAAAKKASKPKSHEVTGTIEFLDTAAGIFAVKGKKGSVSLKAGKKVKLSGFRVGDKVTVKYSDGTANSVKVLQAKRAEPKTAHDPATAPNAEKKPAEKR